MAIEHLSVAYIKGIGSKVFQILINLHIDNGGVIFMAIRIIGGTVH